MIQLMPSAAAAVTDASQVLARHHVSVDTGLSHGEVQERRRQFGRNEMEAKEAESLVSKFFEQFKDPMIVMLLVSAGASLLLGNIEDAISITLAIVIVVTVAFIQEYRSDQSLAAIRHLAPPLSKVLREGRLEEVDATELVPGDIVRVAVGDRVPADLRLVDAVELQVDESSLTGETEPRLKHGAIIIADGGASPNPAAVVAAATGHGGVGDGADGEAGPAMAVVVAVPGATGDGSGTDAEVPLADRSNVCYMGTLVRAGHGTGVVIGTGNNSELGKVFTLIGDQEEVKTPLQTRMDELGKKLSALSFGIIGLIVVIGLIQVSVCSVCVLFRRVCAEHALVVAAARGASTRASHRTALTSVGATSSVMPHATRHTHTHTPPMAGQERADDVPDRGLVGRSRHSRGPPYRSGACHSRARG